MLIIIRGNAATLHCPTALSINMEEMETFTAPVGGQQNNFMELGQAGFAADREAPPDQRTHISKHDSKLIKHFHLSNLPNIPEIARPEPPGIFRFLSTTGTPTFSNGFLLPGREFYRSVGVILMQYRPAMLLLLGKYCKCFYGVRIVGIQF